MYSAFHLEVPFLTPEMANLCNINSKRTWVDFSLEGFQNIMGAKCDQDGNFDTYSRISNNRVFTIIIFCKKTSPYTLLLGSDTTNILALS